MRKYMQETEVYPYKIIAVDDDEGILDSLKVVLKRSGYSLICYSNPKEALKRFPELASFSLPFFKRFLKLFVPSIFLKY